MKRLFLLLSLFLPNLTIYAQQPPTVVLNRTYGSAGDDVSQMVRELQNGDYLIGGTTDGFGEPNGDIYLVRTDAGGNLVWENTYGGPQQERIQWAMNNGLQVNSAGDFIVVGTSRSFGPGDLDFYLLKVQSDGTFLWHKAFGNPGSDEYGRVVRQLSATSGPGYILAGQTFAPANIYLIKTDLSGDAAGGNYWEKVYQLDTWSNAQDIIQTPDDGFLVTGYGGMGAFLMKVDAAGNIEPDYFTFDVNGTPTVQQGDYTVLWPNALGYNIEESYDAGGTLEGYVIAGRINAGGEAFLAKVDLNGNVLWNREIQGPGANYAYAVAQTGNGGGYMVAGETNGMGAGNWDFWVFETNYDATTVYWQETYGGPGPDWATSLQRTQDGGYLVTGLNNSFGSGGGADYWLLKLLHIADPAYIRGKLFSDENGNCMENPGNDLPLFNQMVHFKQYRPQTNQPDRNPLRLQRLRHANP
jgi:hypothetical protein